MIFEIVIPHLVDATAHASRHLCTDSPAMSAFQGDRGSRACCVCHAHCTLLGLQAEPVVLPLRTTTALSEARLAVMQNLMARLKSKRFRQIFEYLDQDQDGLLDLAELLSGGPLA